MFSTFSQFMYIGDVGVTGEGDMSEYLDHIEPTASPRVADRWGPATFHYQDHALHLMVS